MAPAPVHPAPADPGLLAEIVELLTLRGGFSTNLVILGTVLLGAASGVVGVFMLLRKRSLTADAVSHATLPGIGLAFLLAPLFGAEGRAMPVLLLGATVTAVLSGITIQAIVRHTRLRSDAAIAIVLGVFFAAGVVTLSVVQNESPAGSAGLHHLIFGQAATMRPSDVWLMGAMAAGVLVLTGLLFKELALVAFNADFARVTGWPVSRIDLVLMGMVVVVTVAGLQAVGLLLVVAMLIVPSVTARFWTHDLRWLVPLAGAFGAASGFLGSALSALLPDAPAGAVIVLSATGLFSVSFLVAPKRGIIAAALRRLRFRLRIAGDHLLEAGAIEGGEVTAASLAALGRERAWSPVFRTVLAGALRWTGQLGAVPGEPGRLALTPSGLERGRRVRRNHLLWERYLVTRAHLSPTHVDWTVDQVEHVLPDSMVEELERELAEEGAPS